MLQMSARDLGALVCLALGIGVVAGVGVDLVGLDSAAVVTWNTWNTTWNTWNTWNTERLHRAHLCLELGVPGRGMTPEEKRDRRAARRELETAFRRIVTRRIGLFATNNQIRAGVKIMTDRYYAEQVRPAAARIEAQLVSEAQAQEKARAS